MKQTLTLTNLNIKLLIELHLLSDYFIDFDINLLTNYIIIKVIWRDILFQGHKSEMLISRKH